MRKIEVTISKAGDVKAKTTGFSGGSCMTVSEALAKAFDTPADSIELTDEYYSEEQALLENQVMQ